jgi:hypothetical protein
MNLRDRIDDIRGAIRSGRFGNEASISQGIVLPLLQSLDWPIFDTSIVSPEYALEGSRADYALCHPAGKPIAFIEVKRLGQSDGAEKQLFEYAFHKGVQLAILTDGQEWNFFLPAEQGDYGERRVYKLDIVEREIEESVRRLTRYLMYESVRGGEAIDAARDDYRNAARQRQMIDTMPHAWASLLQDGDELLLELLADRVESLCGYKPDADAVANFLKTRVIASGAVLSGHIVPVQPNLPSPTPFIVKLPQATPIGFVLDGQRHVGRNAQDVLIRVFEALAKRDPSFPERFASLPKHGQKRRYLSRSPMELYPGRPDLVRDCSKQLTSGWWIGTNNSRGSIRKIIMMACEVANLRYGSELQVEIGD